MTMPASTDSCRTIAAALLLAASAAGEPFQDDTARMRELHLPPLPIDSAPPVAPKPRPVVVFVHTADEFLAFERSIAPLSASRFERLTQAYERRNAYAQLEAFRHLQTLLSFPRFAFHFAGSWYRADKVSFQVNYARADCGGNVAFEVRIRNPGSSALRDVRLWTALEAYRGAKPRHAREVRIGDLAAGREFIVSLAALPDAPGTPLTRIVIAADDRDGARLELVGYTYWWGLFA